MENEPQGTSREPIKVNLFPEVVQAWKDAKGGLSSTKFAMAGIAAFELLSDPQKLSLGKVIAEVDEEGAAWAIVREWCEKERGRGDTIVGQQVESRHAQTSTRKKQSGRPSK